jgi:hypothetical protein
MFTSPLGYGGFLFFRSGRRFNSRCSGWRSGRFFVSSSKCFFGWFSLFFVSYFLSQIYACSPISIRHAPLSRVLRRRPLLLPVAQVTPIVRVRCVACTRQRALCSLPRVTGMFHHFLALHGGEGVTAAVLRLYGTGDDACRHAPPSLVEPASISSAGTMLYFLLVSSVMIYLYNF